MRDLLITIVVFGILPFIFSRPHIGVYLWSWISYMNPHRFSWGFAYGMPFAAISGGVTIIAAILSIKKLRFFWSPVVAWLIIFNIWMLFTTVFSLVPESAWLQWDKVAKIQLFNFLTLLLINDKDKIIGLVWVIVLSIGFFGIKGGFFTITSGGGSHVLGPPAGFISGNTEIGLALVMILPLVWYLYLSAVHSWARISLMVSALLIAIAIVGTQSRGALLAVGAIGLFIWLKSRKKALLIVVFLLFIPFIFMFMPQSWHDRMNTMEQSYEEDNSLAGRLQAWEFAYTLAVARPLTGGGFETFNPEIYERYTPGIVAQGTGAYHDAHSVYFEILGEHGFVGLGIFLIIWILSWRIANKIIKITKDSEQYRWAHDLAAMLQVAIIGYAVGGSFLGLAYFDLGYHYIAILVVTLHVVEQQQANSNHNARY